MTIRCPRHIQRAGVGHRLMEASSPYEMTALRDPVRLGITKPTVPDYHVFLSHTATTS